MFYLGSMRALIVNVATNKNSLSIRYRELDTSDTDSENLEKGMVMDSCFMINENLFSNGKEKEMMGGEFVFLNNYSLMLCKVVMK